MKYFVFFICNLGSCVVFAQKNNCTVVFHLKNFDSTYYAYFEEGDSSKVIYLDTIANAIDSFSVYFPEPRGVTMFIENDTARMLSFYVSEGRLEIDIDAANTRQSKFINSPLNDEYLFHKKCLDSIKALVYTPAIREKLKGLSPIAPIRDSLYRALNLQTNELDKMQYQEGFKKTGSFFTLSNVYFWLQVTLLKGKDALFTKQQLKPLFNKLDKSLHKYPTYKNCKALFKQKYKSRPDIGSPLYKP